MPSKPDKTNSPLWNPQVGMFVCTLNDKFHNAPDSIYKVIRVWDLPCTAQEIRYHGKKEGSTEPSVEFISVRGLWSGDTPRWPKDVTEGDIWSLRKWRINVPKMTQLPDDWQLPAPKPRQYRPLLTEPQALDLAERVQRLAGRIPEEEFDALIAAVQPAVSWIGRERLELRWSEC